MTPLKLVFHPRARRDLRSIAQYITLRERDRLPADRLMQRIFERCAALARAPGMGSRYVARPGVRKLVEGNYKIFYRADETTIVILRVWDGRRGSGPTF
jgi:plasmid stabilization system protein ParE